MPVPSDITALSTTAGSNFPLGSESPALADDYLRAQASYIAQLRAVIGGAADANIPYAAYKKANILGTVSQTAGVPTGAIIERGINANGEYVRWADGTMICRKTAAAPATLTTTTATGAGYTGAAVTTITLAGTFISPPEVSLTSVFVAGARCWVSRDTVTTTTASAVAFSFSSAGQCQVDYIAVGRWF